MCRIEDFGSSAEVSSKLPKSLKSQRSAASNSIDRRKIDGNMLSRRYTWLDKENTNL